MKIILCITKLLMLNVNFFISVIFQQVFHHLLTTDYYIFGRIDDPCLIGYIASFWNFIDQIEG